MLKQQLVRRRAIEMAKLQMGADVLATKRKQVRASAHT
jgi:hypothetical protein